jgi:hypothetical protein
VLNIAGYARTGLLWHPKPLDQFPGAAWLGVGLPYEPGRITWTYKSLAGVDYTTITETERAALEAKAVNHYTRVAGISITRQGTMSEGGQAFIDIIHSIDFVAARLKEYIFGLLVSVPKVPYTSDGIAQIEMQVKAVMTLGVNQGIFANDPAPLVTVPTMSSIPIADKADRILREVKFEATLAGAIHKIQTISGTVFV